MKRSFVWCSIVSAVLICGVAVAADWTQFRGPGGSAVSGEMGLPVEWSAEENVVWRSELPGLGSSSPIVLGDRIYLTCYSGYGIEPLQGDQKDLMRHVVCLDRNSGKVVWSREVKPKLPESDYRGGNNARHGYSTSTPITDGQHLYVFFGKSGVFCFDLDGKQVWQADVGDGSTGWGSGSSLVLYKSLAIVNASVESRAVVALDKASGREVWRSARIRGSWNTPVLVDLPGGATELVFCIPNQILGLDPATGKELWRCKGIPDGGYVCPSVVANKGIVYAIGGRSNTAIAVRAGGRGDVSQSHELWRTSKGSNVTSPVYHEGHVYWAHERRGMAYCLNAKSGEVVYEERLTPRPGLIYASVTVADGKLYYVSQHNGTYVVAAKPEFELLSHNKFDDDDARANACPVPHNRQLLLRNDRYLYCVGRK